MSLAQTIALALAAYAAVGVIVGAAFVTWGAGRVDPSARGAGIGFRLIILPGSAGLWPVVILAWARSLRRRA